MNMFTHHLINRREPFIITAKQENRRKFGQDESSNGSEKTPSVSVIVIVTRRRLPAIRRGLLVGVGEGGCKNHQARGEQQGCKKMENPRRNCVC